MAVYFSMSSSFNFRTTELNVADRFKNSLCNCGTLTAHYVCIRWSIQGQIHLGLAIFNKWLHCIPTLIHFSISFLLGELKSASSGPLKKLGDMFRRHPEYFVLDQETCFRKVESGCCAYNLMYFAINLVDTSWWTIFNCVCQSTRWRTIWNSEWVGNWKV